MVGGRQTGCIRRCDAEDGTKLRDGGICFAKLVLVRGCRGGPGMQETQYFLLAYSLAQRIIKPRHDSTVPLVESVEATLGAIHRRFRRKCKKSGRQKDHVTFNQSQPIQLL